MNDNDSVYSTLLKSAATFLVIVGLALWIGDTTPTSNNLSTVQGTDLIPSIKDLNPSVAKAPKSDSVAFSNYRFYFEDPGGIIAGIQTTIMGFFVNITFQGAVLFSKLFAFLINFSLNSTIISDVLGIIMKYIGNIGGTFLKTFQIILPIGYGLWAIRKGILQRKYVVAVTGIFGAIFIYVIGMYLSTDGDKVLRALSTSSSRASKEIMIIGTGGKGDATVAINNDIWLSQVYLPWAIMQFGELGISQGSNGELKDSQGNLLLNIGMNDWEIEELNKEHKKNKYILFPSAKPKNEEFSTSDDWSSTLLGPVEANTEGKSLIGEILNNPENSRVSRYKISPEAAGLNSFFLLVLNLLQMVVVGIPSVIVILADAVLAINLILSYLIIFLSLIPNHGARIFRAWLNIIITCIVSKLLYGVYVGFYVMVTTQTYISMFKVTGGSASSIFFSGLITGLISIATLFIGIFLVKKVGVISLGTMAGNLATGRTKQAKEQWSEMIGRFDDIDLFKGKYNPLNYFANNADFQKYILDNNPEEVINEKLNKLKNNGNYGEKEQAKIDAIISQADKLQSSTSNPQLSNKLRGLSLEGQKLKAEINKTKLQNLANGYQSGKVGFQQYANERNKIEETIHDLINSGDRDSIKIGKELNDVLFERDAEISQKQIEDFIKENPFNSASFAERRSEFYWMLDKTEKAVQDGINSTDNRNTLSRLNKVKAFVEEQERQLFTNDYSRTADSQKLEFLQEHLEDDRFGTYARREYDNHKLNLLDQSAETFTESEQRDFWKSEIAKENNKVETARDNKIIEHAKKKLEVIEFADVEQQSRMIPDTGIVYSNGQLKTMIEDTETYLRDVAISGHMKQQAELILGKARTMQSISELSQQDPQIEIDSLHNLIQLPDHKENAQIIAQRLADLESNQFKTDVLEMLRNSSIQPDQYFSELRDNLSKDLSNVTADKTWMNEVIARKQQALDLISKDIGGYLGQTVPTALEPQLYQYVEQLSQQVSEDLQPFIQSIREKIETQSIENTTAILEKMKNEISLSFANANETVKEELQVKLDTVAQVKEKASGLLNTATVNNDWNFEESNKGFNF